MSWPLLGAREGLKLLKNGTPAIDVRSPGEFAVGSIPGFRNIAILDDDHRHQVGLTYKIEGNQRAVELGHRLVDPIRPYLVEGWTKVLGGREGLVICWRGGQRSMISAEWMYEAGLSGRRIEGGYKALRRVLIDETDRPRKWIVVDGLTGSGKSELLRQLDPLRVLDLEALAVHRGSAFGSVIGRLQPSQQTFENAVGLQLLDMGERVVAENESSMVGRCALPVGVAAGIEGASVVRLLVSMEERVARTFGEYIAEPARELGVEPVRQAMLASLGRISKALGGVRYRDLLAMMEKAFAEGVVLEAHFGWIEYLFREYYDLRYLHGLRRDSRAVVFEGDFAAAAEFLRIMR
jgi:tRNA 2-selenouridine synthase